MPSPLIPNPVILGLPIADRRRSYAFYADGLGLQAMGDVADDGVPEPLQVVLNSGVQLMLIPTGGFAWTVPGRAVAEPGTVECQLTITLADQGEVQAFVDRARRAGADVFGEPQQKPWGYTANFADPDGHSWMIVANPPATQERPPG